MLGPALREAHTPTDPWAADHQGELEQVVGRIWRCGDDCGCTQAEIVARFLNLLDERWVITHQLWVGTFRTDHEVGAEDELAAKQAEVTAEEPELAAVILWK